MDPVTFTATLSAPVDVGATLEVLLAGGERKRLSEAERRSLLERVRAGEHVEVAFRARAYAQSAGSSNRNYVRFKPSILAKLARSFVGQPFLRDHGQKTLDDRGGTITEAELIRESDDASAIEMTIRAVKPWAVESLLDGTIDRFSIGWHPTGPILCSVHKGPLRGAESCGCWPGTKSGDETVEAIFTGADGVEVSAVNVPAVPEARGVEIRAALSAWVCESTREHVAAQIGDQMKIATMLGLGGAATEDEIGVALGKLQSSQAALEVRLTAEAERRAMAESKLGELSAAAEVAAKTALDQRVAADIERLYASGRLAVVSDATGARVPHPIEPALRAMVGAIGYEGFKAFADSLPMVAPVGAPMQLSGEGRKAAPENPLYTPAVLATMKAAGISIDDVKKFNGLGVLADGGN